MTSLAIRGRRGVVRWSIGHDLGRLTHLEGCSRDPAEPAFRTLSASPGNRSQVRPYPREGRGLVAEQGLDVGGDQSRTSPSHG